MPSDDDNYDRWPGSEGGVHKCATRAVSAGGATSAQAGREGGEQLFINTIYNCQKISLATYRLQQESKSENHGETFQVCQDIPRQQSRQVPKQVSSFASDVSNMI